MSVKVKLTADVESFRKEMKRSEKAVKGLAGRMRRGSKSMRKSLAKVQARMDVFSAKAGRLALISGGAFAAIGLAIGTTVKAAADLETVRIKFEVLTGSVRKAKEHVEDLVAFTAKTPFQFESVAKASSILQAFGTHVDDVKDRLQVMGDLASATGKDIGYIATVFGQVQSQGKLTLERLNQFQESGLPVLDALAKKLGKTESEVRKMITAGKISKHVFNDAFESMNKKGGIAYRAMIKQSKSFNGLLSTTRDNITIVMQQIGDKFLPRMKEMATSVIDFLTYVQKNPAIVKAAVEFGVLALKVAGAAAVFLTVVAVAAKLISILAGIASAVIFVAGKLSFLGTIASAIAAVILSPWALIAAGIAAVAGAIYLTVTGRWGEMWQKMKTLASEGWEWIKNLFSSMGGWISSTFSGMWKKVKAIVKGDVKELARIYKEEEAAEKALLMKNPEYRKKIAADEKERKEQEAAENLVLRTKKKAMEDKQKQEAELLAEEERQKALEKRDAEYEEDLEALGSFNLGKYEKTTAHEQMLKDLDSAIRLEALAVEAARKETDAKRKKKHNDQAIAAKKARSEIETAIEKHRHDAAAADKEKFFGHMERMTASSNKILAGIGKVASIRQIWITTRKAAMDSFDFANKFGGPIAGAIAAGATIAFGAEQAVAVAGLYDGGSVLARAGASPYRDSVPARLSVGETVISRELTGRLNKMTENNTVNKIDARVTVEIAGDLIADSDERVDDLIARINERVETGNGRLVASAMEK